MKPTNKLKKEIISLLETKGHLKVSDISEHLKIDCFETYRIVDELIKEGKIEEVSGN